MNAYKRSYLGFNQAHILLNLCGFSLHRQNSYVVSFAFRIMIKKKRKESKRTIFSITFSSMSSHSSFVQYSFSICPRFHPNNLLHCCYSQVNLTNSYANIASRNNKKNIRNTKHTHDMNENRNVYRCYLNCSPKDYLHFLLYIYFVHIYIFSSWQTLFKIFRSFEQTQTSKQLSHQQSDPMHGI